jgi:hypothetical protein
LIRLYIFGIDLDRVLVLQFGALILAFLVIGVAFFKIENLVLSPGWKRSRKRGWTKAGPSLRAVGLTGWKLDPDLYFGLSLCHWR